MSGWVEVPEAKVKRVRQVEREYGEWLRGYHWDHWVTLTVTSHWPSNRLKTAFVDEFWRYTTKAAKGPVAYAMVIEGGAMGDQAHVHALLHGTASIAAPRLASAWRYGRATAETYDPKRGAAYYLAKELGERALDFDCSTRMPPLANRG